MNEINKTGLKKIENVASVYSGNKKVGRARYLCFCGNETIKRCGDVNSGRTKSCGCLHPNRIKASNHGLSKHPLYGVWLGMKNRCGNKTKSSKYYLDKGVVVCDDWAKNPEKFIRWALNSGWAKGLEIDRLDNDGDYDPSNCRFVTHSENMFNQSTSKRWFISNVKYKSLKDASEKTGFCPSKVKRICDGYYSRGKFYPPKQGCYSISHKT